MTLHNKDNIAMRLAVKLARATDSSKQDALKGAGEPVTERVAAHLLLRERIAAWRKAHPLPPPTGDLAAKQFFDDLSGDP